MVHIRNLLVYMRGKQLRTLCGLVAAETDTVSYGHPRKQPQHWKELARCPQCDQLYRQQLQERIV